MIMVTTMIHEGEGEDDDDDDDDDAACQDVGDNGSGDHLRKKTVMVMKYRASIG